jgi:hypothetical protein
MKLKNLDEVLPFRKKDIVKRESEGEKFTSITGSLQSES